MGLPQLSCGRIILSRFPRSIRMVVKVFHFETAWTKGFKKNPDFDINESASPLVSFMCSQLRAQYIYRQVHSPDDLAVWCRAVAGARKSDRKILWLSGHGDASSGFRFNRGNDELRTDIKTVFRAIQEAGPVDGLVFDSCEQGKLIESTPKAFPRNLNWTLATDKSLEFADGTYLMAKALGWILEGDRGDFHSAFENGMQTNFEEEGQELSFTKIVRETGLRIFWMKGHKLLWSPTDKNKR